MDLLQDLKKSLLNFNFVMIYTIHKVLVLIKNPLNYLKDNIFKFFLRNITDFYLFIFFLIIFFTTHNEGKPKFWRRKDN